MGSPPTINVLAPVTSKVENSKTDYPVHKEQKPSMKSVETQNTPPTINVLAPVTPKVENSKTDTRSIGVVTESPLKVKKYDQTSQTPILNNNVRSARDDNHSPQDNNPSAHLHHSSPIENSIIQIENNPQISKEKIPSNTHLQYIVPDPEFQKAINFSTYQHSATLPQPQPQHMNTIEYSTPLALPQPKPMNTIQHFTPQTLSQQQPSINPQINHLPPSQTHPQLMDTSTNTEPPQLMDYSVNQQNSASALPAPEEDDCKECAVTKYRKYDVSLPYSRGLPENSVFTCTLCETNFSTKKSLQRHMKT